MTLDFNRFEILTFDCYGTLIDWETGLLSALRRILSAHGKEIDDATLLELYGNFEQRSEHGAFHPYREVLQSVVKQFGDELGFVPTAEEARSLPDSLAMWEALARHGRGPAPAEKPLSPRHPLQRGRRSFRSHAAPARSGIR
jgi:2-haloacid dehalogenase